MMKYTKEDLKKMQSWSLERKIQVTQTRIMEWYMRWNGQVYVSFSGGKDSTVLLDLARRIYPDIEAVFIDTGLEYPEIREFVKTKEGVTWLYPIKYSKQKKQWVRTSFKEVIETYGYPVISKDVADAIYKIRKKPDGCRAKRFDPNSEYVQKYGARYDLSKWKHLLESDIPISHMCCDVMKKNPAKKYEKESKKHPILGTMASESRLRVTSWIRHGCNAFDAKRPTSQPMAFWTEQDIFQYLKRFKIPYASIYGDIVENEHGKLMTTGASRTGCMFCMFGVHLEKEPNRFQRMAVTHPQLYDYCINKLGCGKVLDYIGVNYQPLQGKEVNDC
jgi:3'-phosphoadenosine 5'-phosphosulfate sulfotransferase (PAPS reductase)/FAD synthetase